MPHPAIAAPPGPKQSPLDVILHPRPPFDVRYTEGLDAGYKWFDARHLQPLFPFGYGLSYSRFVYFGLSAAARSGGLDVGFSLRNTSR